MLLSSISYPSKNSALTTTVSFCAQESANDSGDIKAAVVELVLEKEQEKAAAAKAEPAEPRPIQLPKQLPKQMHPRLAHTKRPRGGVSGMDTALSLLNNLEKLNGGWYQPTSRGVLSHRPVFISSAKATYP